MRSNFLCRTWFRYHYLHILLYRWIILHVISYPEPTGQVIGGSGSGSYWSSHYGSGSRTMVRSEPYLTVGVLGERGAGPPPSPTFRLNLEWNSLNSCILCSWNIKDKLITFHKKPHQRIEYDNSRVYVMIHNKKFWTKPDTIFRNSECPIPLISALHLNKTNVINLFSSIASFRNISLWIPWFPRRRRQFVQNLLLPIFVKVKIRIRNFCSSKDESEFNSPDYR